MLTPIRQLPTLPRVPEYCRATPGEARPSLGKPVSSTTHTCGRTTATALQQQFPQMQGALLALVPPEQRREHLGGEPLQPITRRRELPSPHTAGEQPDTHHDKTS